MSRPRLFVIDGTALIFRAYFAFERSPLYTADGRNTQALYGTLLLLRRLLDSLSPDRWVVVFDTGKPTFRHERYVEYKAHRPPAPEELNAQFPWVKEALDALNVPRVEVDGYEADDAIATIAERAVKSGYDVEIVTGDKDLLQLVGEHVRVQRPIIRTGGQEFEVMDEAAVVAKHGVRPDQIIDFLGLTGDSSDNIPGVPLIGPKTAAELLGRFGTMEAVLAHAPEEKKGKRWENLVAHAEDARLSKELATLHRGVPLDASLDDFAVKRPDAAKFMELCRRFEMPTLVERFVKQEDVEVKPTAHSYEVVDSPDALRAFTAEAKKRGRVAVDMETTSISALDAEPVGVAMSIGGGTGVYVPVAHVGGPNVEWRQVAGVVGPLLSSKRVRKVFHNAKYDVTVLARAGLSVENFDDTLLMSYLLAPNARAHNLDSLASAHLGHTTIPITDLIGSGRDQKSFGEVDVPRACEYASEDADVALRLWGAFSPRIDEEGLRDVYERCELPLVVVLSEMEREGVRVDVGQLEKYAVEIDRRLAKIERKVYDAAGREFNINSTKQLAEVLFDEIKLPVVRETKTGRSTDADVLEELAGEHPLPGMLLEHRLLSKLKGTYVDALPRLVNPGTGRVHTSFNQAVTATGRLASSDPNLQNIPVRTPEGRRIREAFVPRDRDHVIMSFDYSQIELRILAHLSGDERLREAFERGRDVHAATAAAVFGVPLKEVTPDMRAVAKVVNFSAVYGTSPYGLSRQSNMSPKEAKVFLDAYFKQYAGVKRWTEETIERARGEKKVRTILGRIRPVPEITARDFSTRQGAERAAVNTCVQGSAADMIKLAMIAVHRELNGRGMRSKMVLQVHDELVFDAHKSEVKALDPLVAELMRGAIPLSVPVVVDCGVGDNWSEAH